MKVPKQITQRQLRSIVDDYHQLLPEWKRIALSTIGRVEGASLQVIFFETLSGGDYRPMHFVQVTCVPRLDRDSKADFFFSHPEGRFNTARIVSHAELCPKIFESMRVTFTPSIVEPLQSRQLLELCERSAIPRSQEAFSLAFFNAYYGRFDRSRIWSNRFNELVDSQASTWQEWHHRQRNSLDSLMQWISCGESQKRLNEVLEETLRQRGFE